MAADEDIDSLLEQGIKAAAAEVHTNHNSCSRVRERDLEKFFGQLGKVENVLLLRDKYTNRSKGIAYVEMSNLEDVPKVLMLSGHVPPFPAVPDPRQGVRGREELCRPQGTRS
ncbi:hypothetical protein PINS_up019548 [Pythium insidiosum]|nr:hypothetical protein PINS_up019548 [Pythium insidiosum]